MVFGIAALVIANIASRMYISMAEDVESILT